MTEGYATPKQEIKRLYLYFPSTGKDFQPYEKFCSRRI